MIDGTGPLIGDETLQDMLGYMVKNKDVWLGWAWWGGGPWWASNSLFHIDPVSGQDQKVLGAIKPYFAVGRTGDINRDGHVNSTDIPALLEALADMNQYKTSKSLSDPQLKMLADVNNDNLVNNKDIQALLDLLKAGGGISTPYPSPAPLFC